MGKYNVHAGHCPNSGRNDYGGDGSATKVMREVDNLPIKKTNQIQEEYKHENE